MSAKQTIAYVHWKDASGQSEHVFVGRDELSKGKPLHTAGLVVEEDDEFISLAQDADLSDEDDPAWRTIIHIPLVNIIKMRKFCVSSKNPKERSRG